MFHIPINMIDFSIILLNQPRNPSKGSFRQTSDSNIKESVFRRIAFSFVVKKIEGNLR